MQHLGAFPWATAAGMRKAAEHTDVTTSARTLRYRVGLRTFAMMGLPPLDSAMVGRAEDGLAIAFRAGDLEDDSDLAYHLGPEDINAVYSALEKRTHLAKRKRIALAGAITIRSQIVMISIADAELAEIFGHAEWQGWKAKHPQGEAGEQPAAVGNDLTLRERMRIETFFREKLRVAPSGTATRLDRNLLQLVDEVEADATLLPAIRGELDKGIQAPARAVDVFTLRDLIDKAKFERDRARQGFDPANDIPRTPGAFTGFDIAARIEVPGLPTPDRAVPISLELAWDEIRTALAFSPEAFAKFRNHDWHVEVEWSFERTDRPAQPQERTKTSALSVDHTFQLGANESTGHFTVHAFMRSSHFPPKHVTAFVDVKREDTRMAELRDEAMGDMKPAAATWTPYRFETGVRDDIARHVDPRQTHKSVPGADDPDRDGFEIRGALPRDWKIRTTAERAKQRAGEIARYEKMIAYLVEEQTSGKAGYQDAINAARDRLTQLQEADRAVAADTTGRARPFELRGTYLNRNGDAPSSGPLDLYATVTMQKIDGSIEYEVKIRDLSNKVAPNSAEL